MDSGNILVTIVSAYEQIERYIMLKGQNELIDFLQHYDETKYSIVAIEILGADVNSVGVEEPNIFLKDTGLEYGN